MVLLWFLAIFDLEFGLLAKNDVECSAPDLKGRLGVDFLEGALFSQTPVGTYRNQGQKHIGTYRDNPKETRPVGIEIDRNQEH